MKNLRISLLGASLATLAALNFAPAQEAAKVPPQEPPPAPTAAPSPNSAVPEVTLIPEREPEVKKPAEPEKVEKSKTEESAEELLERIHYREANTKARRDPKVQAEWDTAMHARTDLDKRNHLKEYYKLLHARILVIDPSVKKMSDLHRTTSVHRLEQTRIDATEPLDPQERAERFQAASE